MVQRALKECGVVLRTLATDAGVSYGLLRQWAVGHRSPSAENVNRIASGLDARADRLHALAEALRKTTRQTP